MPEQDSDGAALLELRGIGCRYGSHVVVPELSLRLAPGRIGCLLGPSGCGKTTALRAIAGFEPIFQGSIHLRGELLSDARSMLPPERRRVGMVFQDFALFPHLSVSDNIGFGLHGQPKAERRAAVERLLALVKLEDYARAYPHQLSGGQQQRVALARALAPGPRLLLLDEPFSSLDTELRRSLSVEVRNILKAAGTGAILVTHDQTEAFNMADEIGVLNAGRLEQWGSPQTLYHQPATAFVAAFISQGKFILGRTLADGRVATPFGELALPTPRPSTLPAELPSGSTLRLLVRPWQIAAAPSGCPATIAQQQFLGAGSLTTLRLDDGSLLDSNDPTLAALPVGERVHLQLQSSTDLLVFPA